MKIRLADVAVVKAGHPFRGAIQATDSGNGYVIQVRDMKEDGQIDWDNLVCTKIVGRKELDWLVEGDILFVSRGPRNIAGCLRTVPKHAVCAPHFFQIKVKDPSVVQSEFLAWQLNQIPAQRYFSQSAEGSSQLSIRRTVLEKVPLVIPSMEKQHLIVALSDKVSQEKQVLMQLIDNRRQQMSAIAKDILK